MLERRDKINYYLDLAEIVGQRGTCLRRHYGAVIVKNDEVISTGYVGAPRGRKNCSDLGICIRQKMNVLPLCSVHENHVIGFIQPFHDLQCIALQQCDAIFDSKDEYRMIHVQQWIDDDESLAGSFGY